MRMEALIITVGVLLAVALMFVGDVLIERNKQKKEGK